VLSSCESSNVNRSTTTAAHWQLLRDQGFVAFIYGNYKEAQLKYGQALAELRKSQESDPVEAALLTDLAEAYQSDGSYEKSRETYKIALQIINPHYQLERQTSAYGVGTLLVKCLVGLAQSDLEIGNNVEADRLYQQALRIAPQLLLPKGELDRLSASYRNIVQSKFHQGTMSVAEQAAGEDNEPSANLTTRPNLPDTWQFLREQAFEHYASHSLELAAKRLRNAVDQISSKRKTHKLASPGTYLMTSELLTCITELAIVEQELGDELKAESTWREALRLSRAELWPGHPGLADSLGRLARFLKSRRKFSEAAPLLAEAVTIREAGLKTGSNLAASSLSSDLEELGFIYYHLKKFDLAEKSLKRAVEIETKSNKLVIASIRLDQLARIYSLQNRFQDEVAARRTKLHLLISDLGPDHLEVGKNLCTLGTALARCGKVDEAEHAILNGIAIQQKCTEPDDPLLTDGLMALGNLYRTQGKLGTARAKFQQALKIKGKKHSSDGAKLSEILTALSDLDCTEGNIPRANTLQERALAEEKQSAAPDLGRLEWMLARLRDIQTRLGNQNRIEEINQELIELRKKM
jgi:tetratricopeptide (TPR) repeat protein